MLFTPPNMILHPGPYAEVPKQPCNDMLASVNAVNSTLKMIQPEQPEDPEARVYGSEFEVWPYGLFPVGKIIAKMRVYCVYNYLPLVILQLTINELSTLWDVHMLLQEKLEELDQKTLLVQFLSSVLGKTLLLASDYLISSRI